MTRVSLFVIRLPDDFYTKIRIGEIFEGKMLVYKLYVWQFLNIFGQLVNFVVIRYVFFRFGMLYQEKSGKPECL
jgi:hypothetical protein